ncbi:MAG: hypothetical protein IJ347_08000 [Faecalibacterium sp.]|nr:hypothetical protein [Faecalibacterium sp.]
MKYSVRIWFAAILLLCAAALGLSILCMTAPRLLPGMQRQLAAPQYLARDEGGRLAIYPLDSTGAAGSPVTYDIYVNLLPEYDVLKLRAGIYLADARAVQQLLEDLGG